MVHTRHSFLKDEEEHLLENGELSGQEATKEQQGVGDDNTNLDATEIETENNNDKTEDMKEEEVSLNF